MVQTYEQCEFMEKALMNYADVHNVRHQEPVMLLAALCLRWRSISPRHRGIAPNACLRLHQRTKPALAPAPQAAMQETASAQAAQRAQEVLYDDIGTFGRPGSLHSEPAMQLYENTKDLASHTAAQSAGYENLPTGGVASPPADPKPVVYGELDFPAGKSGASAPALHGEQPGATYVTLKQPGSPAEQATSTDPITPPGGDAEPDSEKVERRLSSV